MTKYVWSDNQKFRDFKRYVDDMDNAYDDSYVALGAAYASAGAAYATCLETSGLGCVVGGAAYAISMGTYYYYLRKARINEARAAEEFLGIKDIRLNYGPPKPPSSSPPR